VWQRSQPDQAPSTRRTATENPTSTVFHSLCKLAVKQQAFKYFRPTYPCTEFEPGPLSLAKAANGNWGGFLFMAIAAVNQLKLANS